MTENKSTLPDDMPKQGGAVNSSFQQAMQALLKPSGGRLPSPFGETVEAVVKMGILYPPTESTEGASSAYRIDSVGGRVVETCIDDSTTSFFELMKYKPPELEMPKNQAPIPLEILGFTTRVYNLLKGADINTLKDLFSRRKEVRNIRGIGPKSMLHIAEAMYAAGFRGIINKDGEAISCGFFD